MFQQILQQSLLKDSDIPNNILIPFFSLEPPFWSPHPPPLIRTGLDGPALASLQWALSRWGQRRLLPPPLVQRVRAWQTRPGPFPGTAWHFQADLRGGTCVCADKGGAPGAGEDNVYVLTTCVQFIWNHTFQKWWLWFTQNSLPLSCEYWSFTTFSIY